MTEKIQKAIDKIDQEAEKMGSATVRLLVHTLSTTTWSMMKTRTRCWMRARA